MNKTKSEQEYTKCKFSECCKYYGKDKFTCNHPTEWKEYCGIAREALNKNISNSNDI
jgi:hypothetical protein